MQSPNASHTQQLEAALKAPILPPEEHRRPYSCQSFDNMLSSSSAYSVIGDYIGMESCLDLEDNEEVYSLKGAGGDSENESHKAHNRCRGKRDQRLASKKKEFPPPIPMLAQTGNLPSHTPWVLKRECTSDGRLILTEEKVRHHEYFQAHKANGRLTLQLVPLDQIARSDFSRIDIKLRCPRRRKGRHKGTQKISESEMKRDLIRRGPPKGKRQADVSIGRRTVQSVRRSEILPSGSEKCRSAGERQPPQANHEF
ncbi:hypothetical protein CJ030_MR7G010612 [Morella rubra]|uniref:FAF domain-containing protein n=1 Tax=Morella rubra TaxID=262757 RepID=A0A6A1V0M8_9ROSI|nr:hypothetical protein CJ030_MR7G010612 [Morella rubra]